MTKQELETIKDYLNELVKFDFDKYITDNFPKTKLENVMFRECNAIEFKKLYKSIIKRLESLIYSDIAIMLPLHYSCNESLYNIVDVIQDLKNYLKRENNEYIFDEIEKVFNYYIQFGNWDKNLIYKPSFSQENIEKFAEEIQLIQTKLNQENEQLKGLMNVYSELKKELDDKLAQANEFYKTIKQKSKSAIENDSSIRSYLSSAETNKNTIETLKTNIANLERKITENIENYRKRFEEVIIKNTRSLSLIKEAEELQSEILSQRDTVENLIGVAADGSLGTHFKKRKNQIRTNVFILIGLVVLSLVFTIYWVDKVFSGFDINNSDWVHFVINVLRTSPAWFLVWWLIDRYTKERKLQEEYAFKSAIAMTMREHSKLLKDTDSGDIDKRDSQQIMLLKALENIYRNPDTRQDKEKDNLTPKNVEGFLSKLTELIKEFRFKN